MNTYLIFILKRFLQSIPTLWLVITISFFMIRLAPGGPFDMERQLPPVVEANLKAYYNLDKNLFIQYFDYLSGILQGDFGPSYNYRDFSVADLILDGLPYSAIVGFWSLLLAIFGGILLGSISALYRNSYVDYTLMTFSMLGLAIPNFVLAPVLILWLCVWNDWFPAGGWGDGGFANLALPVITLGTAYMGNIARTTRGAMIEALGANHIRTARAKGLPEKLVVWRHAMKSAMIPVVSYLGPVSAGIITGSLVIEQIFGLPGVGRYFVQGALGRDYTLVMGTVILYGGLIIIANLIVDIIYGFLNPRIREEK